MTFSDYLKIQTGEKFCASAEQEKVAVRFISLCGIILTVVSTS